MNKEQNDLWARIKSGKPPKEIITTSKRAFDTEGPAFTKGPPVVDPFKDEALILFLGRQTCSHCGSVMYYNKTEGVRLARVKTVHNKLSRIFVEIAAEKALARYAHLPKKIEHWDEEVNGCTVCMEEIFEEAFDETS